MLEGEGGRPKPRTAEARNFIMATTTNIPITITPEAATRVAELGMQREFAQMLDHAKQAIPRLRALTATLTFDPEEEVDPRVLMLATVPLPERPEEDKTEWDFGRWQIHTFPPAVSSQFCLMTEYEAPHGR
jgi:hypothetical protein